jgi:hypothetical protein
MRWTLTLTLRRDRSASVDEPTFFLSAVSKE